MSVQIQGERFRPNLVVSGGATATPNFEDSVQSFAIQNQTFTPFKKCARCEMVCIDQTSGEIRPETLKSLSKYRRSRGQIFFGMLFSSAVENAEDKIQLQINQPIKWNF
jgi:molybdenum cofactor sulfurtransferase